MNWAANFPRNRNFPKQRLRRLPLFAGLTTTVVTVVTVTVVTVTVVIVTAVTVTVVTVTVVTVTVVTVTVVTVTAVTVTEVTWALGSQRHSSNSHPGWRSSHTGSLHTFGRTWIIIIVRLARYLLGKTGQVSST